MLKGFLQKTTTGYWQDYKNEVKTTEDNKIIFFWLCNIKRKYISHMTPAISLGPAENNQSYSALTFESLYCWTTEKL